MYYVKKIENNTIYYYAGLGEWVTDLEKALAFDTLQKAQEVAFWEDGAAIKE